MSAGLRVSRSNRFIPPSIGVGDSTEDSYLMLPDSLTCTRNDMDFVCDSISEEDTGIGATLSIVNEITGTIIDEETMILDFDVTIESCEAWDASLLNSHSHGRVLLSYRRKDI